MTARRNAPVNELETHLERYHALLASAGLAHVVKIPAPIVPVSGPLPGNERRLVCERRTRIAVDYLGHDARGRHVCIEAKMASGPRFPHDNVSSHQLAMLEAAERAGAHAWLVIMHRDGPHARAFYRVPPSYIGNRVRARMAGEPGAMASVTWATLEARGYRCAGGPHWLDGEMRPGAGGPLFAEGDE